MKGIHFVLVIYLAVFFFSTACGQDANPPPCPFTADEVKSLDLNPIKNTCSEFRYSPGVFIAAASL
jgi:hypothetical protein